MSEEEIYLPSPGSIPGIPGVHAPGRYTLDRDARTMRPLPSPDNAPSAQAQDEASAQDSQESRGDGQETAGTSETEQTPSAPDTPPAAPVETPLEALAQEVEQLAAEVAHESVPPGEAPPAQSG